MNLPPCTHCAGTGQGPPPGAELRRLRESLDPMPSIGCYARALGVSTSFLSEVERGKKPAPRQAVEHYFAEDWFRRYPGMAIRPGREALRPDGHDRAFVALAGSTDFGWGDTETEARDDAIRRYKERR